MKCIGASTGNICTVRCRNNALAGPFGGCFAVQQVDVTANVNTPENIETGISLEEVNSQVLQDQADLPAALAANALAGSTEAEQNLAAVNALIGVSVTSKSAAIETPTIVTSVVAAATATDAASAATCVKFVPARNDNDARSRLDNAFGDVDAKLKEHYTGLAKDHLEVIARDLVLPRPILSQHDSQRLATIVDQIVHPGALVSHRLSYQIQFDPNVVGTAELVRLAVMTRQKRVDYVSTIGVPYANVTLRDAEEDADIRVFAHETPVETYNRDW
ncbi:hypothetical protein SCUCBS95973_008794 [Sporothrix curviconia]|uniref:Thioester reductase (TE) domain-containing protein n=1 Tax=Sporothrix curviconia TaxID=1260050 RepID=A0ABP0CS57_9PEZI